MKTESSPVISLPIFIQKSYAKKAIIKNLFQAKKFNQVVNYHQNPMSIMNENFCKQLFLFNSNTILEMILIAVFC